MSTHQHIDRICVAVLICTVLLTLLFMNGESFGLQPVINGDSENSTASPYFTGNDRDGDWDSSGATRITLTGDGANVRGYGAYVYDGDVVIAQAGHYVISGTLDDGSIIVDADSSAKVWLLLDGAEINCADDACLQILSAKKVFLTLAAGTENRMESGAEFSEAAVADKRGGTVTAHDDLTINGSGSLSITANYKHGIDAKDDLAITGGTITVNAAQDALHVNEALYIEQAALTLLAGDEGVNVESAEELVYLDGVTLRIDSTGDGLRTAGDLILCDTTLTLNSGADGLDLAGSLTLEGGNLTLTAADDAVNAEGDVTIESGALVIDAGDDAIHADNSFRMEDGSLLINRCYEGIEALTIDIGGGDISLYPTDDGLNANGGSGFGFGGFGRPGQQSAVSESADSETWVHIRGGTLTIVNDSARDADGIDSNGDIVISGGTIRVSLTSSGSNNAIDYGSESGGTFTVTGGEIVACGSSTMAEGFGSASTQCGILYNLGSNAAAGTAVSVLDEAGNVLLSYEAPCAFNSVTLSSPALTLGGTYILRVGETETSVTLEETTTTIGSGQGGFNGFGGMPGGNGRGGRRGEQSSENAAAENQTAWERPTRPEGSAMPTPPDDFDMPTPPEGFEAPEGFELPEGFEMPSPSGNGESWGGRPDGQFQPGGERPGMQQPDDPAEEAAGEDETGHTDPAVIAVLLAACLLVLPLGILFVLRYRR